MIETSLDPNRTDGPLGEELMRIVGRLRRVVRRRVRRDWPHRPLQESELELLRFVAASPNARVLDAAAELAVAPNTISTLVGRLSARGLLRRTADPEDARAARLSLTPQARRRMAMWRDRRQVVVDAAIADLDASDRRVIVESLPALRRLADLLEEP